MQLNEKSQYRLLAPFFEFSSSTGSSKSTRCGYQNISVLTFYIVAVVSWDHGDWAA